MKFAIALLFLAGCASTPAPKPKHTYRCTLFNAHGSYASMMIFRTSLEDAEHDAAEVRDRLVKMNVIPDCNTICELK